MSAKIFSFRSALLFFALAGLISGCTPAGPHALLQGKSHLDQGDYAAATGALKNATALMPTNAAAWNYYGVALQGAGRRDEAATAYQLALRWNRDLVEAHLNLGSLWLEQGKADAAKAEFTAFTQFRPNDPSGWLRLGSAQLKLGEIVPAERSFSTVLALKANRDAEAYNGLGLARVQRGKPRDAVQFFAAAIQSRPGFAPAIINLATVSQQSLHDNRTALKNYRLYLALTPRGANWDEVNLLANSLEQAQTLPPAVAPPDSAVKTNLPTPAPEPKQLPKTPNPVAVHPPAVKPVEPTVKTPTHVTPHPALVTNAAPVNSAPVETVTVAPPPPIVTTVPTNPVVAAASPEPAPAPEAPKGFWHRLLTPAPSKPKPKFKESGVTPLPAAGESVSLPPAPAVEAAPPPSFPRYNYLASHNLAAGDRRAASGAFTKAQGFEQDKKWADALTWYQTAAQLDPSWFEAQYNTGALAHRLRNFSIALPGYERALALQPDSADARYYFALALKAAGYAPDAAEEFRKVLATHPGDVRSHLGLANLCAQVLHDRSQARQHYLKVLELEPNHAQASEIRFWISANPQ